MKKSQVFYLEQSEFKSVPWLIEQAAPELFKKDDFVVLKLHFGEKGNKGFIKPEWVRPVVDFVKKEKGVPYLTDTNTIYRGQRGDGVSHLALAHGHGFRLEKTGAPVVISDGVRGGDFVEVPVKGKHFEKVKIAKGIFDAHAMIVLSHTKGHILTGFGGAIKNLGMGCGSKGGKYEMHSAISPQVIEEKCAGCGACIIWCPGRALSLKERKIYLDAGKCIGCGECIQACATGALEIPWDNSSKEVQERMVEYAAGAVLGKHVCYVNYMHFISKHCDCFQTDSEQPLLDNLGILVSSDPVAIDQASIDIINKKAGKDLFAELHGKDYSVQLSYAEETGLGSRCYEIHPCRS